MLADEEAALPRIDPASRPSMSTVVARPSRMSSARQRPMAGAVLKPVPENPHAR